MSTPLHTVVEEYLGRQMSRFHMPGHKGHELPVLGAIAQYDLTEIPGLDSLYEANGAIAETEATYTRLYGSAGSFLSAGGSTLCIQTMLALAAPSGSKIVATRGAHAAAIGAMALLDLNPVWVYPEYSSTTGLTNGTSTQALEQTLRANPDTACVYITSPTFFGAISDIPALATVCRRYNVPLLVDNAHGAHLKFLPTSLHPLDQGADMCSDSLHKTMPVLTGGALLHIKNPAYLPRAKQMMALFGSTSPSYPIMLSCDVALTYIAEKLKEDLMRVCSRLSSIGGRAKERGFLTLQGISDPIRLTLGFSGIGYTRDAFNNHLVNCRIEPEFLGDHFCVCIASGQTSARDYSRLRALVEQIAPGAPLPRRTYVEIHPQPAVSLRVASLSDCEPVALAAAAGRVAASTVNPCPPGVPLVMPGEKIDADLVRLLKSYGIVSVNVVK